MKWEEDGLVKIGGWTNGSIRLRDGVRVVLDEDDDDASRWKRGCIP